MQRDLVEAARSGDHAAFEVLAAAESGRLYAFARLVLGDAHQAEDAVQDALIRAWRGLPELRDPELWHPWLHRLIVNACADREIGQQRSMSWRRSSRARGPNPNNRSA